MLIFLNFVQTNVICRPNGLKLTSADVCVGAETQTLMFFCCQHSCLQCILSPLFLSFHRHTLLHTHLCYFSFSALHHAALCTPNQLELWIH